MLAIHRVNKTVPTWVQKGLLVLLCGMAGLLPMRANTANTANYETAVLTEEDTCQWVVMYVSPQTAIVTIDSTTYRTMNGKVQAYLPVGEHTYQVESPFFQSQSGVVTVVDSVRSNLHVHLHPFYSYLEIDTHLPKATIYIDGKQVGVEKASSGRIVPGVHKVAVYQGEQKIFSTQVNVQPSQRKVIDFKHQTDAAGNGVSYGWLNVSANVIDAQVYIGDNLVGHTPCIAYDVPANATCTVCVKKEGYRTATYTVLPVAGQLINLQVNLKKK